MTSRSAAGHRIPTWLLPGELATYQGWPAGRRTVRDWLVDTAMFLVALLVWAVNLRDMVLTPDPDYAAVVPDWVISVDPWVGVAACAAIWLRRRFPVSLAVAMVPVLMVSATSLGAGLISIFSVAIHRSWPPAVLVTAAQAGQGLWFALVYQPAGLSVIAYAINVAVGFAVPLAWGLVVRSRRQVLVSLRREAQWEREDYQRRLGEARRAERERIAREMHDVLAHRISLLSVHAGALAYRTARAEAGAAKPLSGVEVGEAVQIIRENAHQALTELGEVLAVLRADEPISPAHDAPPPLLTDITQLVQEASAAGQRVSLTLAPELSHTPPRPQEQRTVYRVVQEGLTNARKHAVDSPVTVRVAGAPGEQLMVTVTNPLPAGVALGDIPGTGAGLAGLAERVALDHGTLQHGPMAGDFRLAAQLPWHG